MLSIVPANYLAWNIVKYFAKDVSVSLKRHSFAIDKLLYGVNDKISRYKHGSYSDY